MLGLLFRKLILKCKGVIVEIISDTDLPSATQLRTRFSDYGCVAYVDRVNAKSGFVRFNNQSGAQSSIEKEDFYTLSLLTGQREEQYWEVLINKVRRLPYTLESFTKISRTSTRCFLFEFLTDVTRRSKA